MNFHGGRTPTMKTLPEVNVNQLFDPRDLEGKDEDPDVWLTLFFGRSFFFCVGNLKMKASELIKTTCLLANMYVYIYNMYTIIYHHM